MKTRDALTRPVPEALDLPELESKLDDEHPWPGLEGYDEGDQEFFRGRSEEIDQLYRLIRRERLTLLYGKSGTGKSSLLRAGLFPMQRREEALPVWVRLDYAEDAPPLGDQVKTAIHAAAQASDLEAPPPSEAESLWEYLHLRRGEFWSRHHRIIMPFIVFDQFEELFTHGLVNAGAEREFAVKAFISELSDLAEDRVPAALLEDEARAARCNLGRHHYKLVVSLQEEHLADLDRMRDDLPPALFHNRMRLTGMTRAQAKEVVTGVGKTVGADVLADEIVRKASEDTREQGRDSESGVSKPCVDPTLLAVLCTTLNQKRIEDGAAKISRDHLEAIGSGILKEFYERQLASLPEIPDEASMPSGRTRSQEVNDRLAREFVDGDVRVSIPPSRARTVLGDAALAKLVADKILGYTPHGRVELLHDVLPETVRTSSFDFLNGWVDALRGSVRLARTVAGVAGAVAAVTLAWLLYDQATNHGNPDPLPDDPVFTPFPPVGTQSPTGLTEAIALTETIVQDLNEGTRRIYATVGELGTPGRFQQAGITLGDLRGFLEPRIERFCTQSPLGTWRREQVNLVLNHTCAAFTTQRDQFTTLQGLFLRGEEALVDSGVRDQVVGAWEDLEDAFNDRQTSINDILAVWQREAASAP